MIRPVALALALLSSAHAPLAQTAPPRWTSEAVVYRIVPQRFANGDPTNDPARASPDEVASGGGGDLQGVLDRAPYLDSLGVTVVLLSSLFDAAGARHIDPHLGPDPESDRARIAAETADPAAWTWTAADRLFLAVVDELHDRSIRVVLDGAPAHAFDAARRWLDPDGDGDPSDGIDGWHLGGAGERPVGFWRDWNALVRELNPEAVTLTEEARDAPRSRAGADVHDTANDSAFATPARAFFDTRRMSASAFGRALVDGFGASSAPPLTRTARRDAVRAPTRREREVQRQVVALQMAMPGVPALTSGDEAGLWGDPHAPMVWPGLAETARATRGLPRDREASPTFDHALFAFYRRALALRRSDPVLQRGTLQLLVADDRRGTVAFARVLGGDRRVIVVNRSDESQFVRLPGHTGFAPMTPLLTSTVPDERIPGLNVRFAEDGTATVGVRVPPRTTLVYRPTEDADVRPGGLDE